MKSRWQEIAVRPWPLAALSLLMGLGPCAGQAPVKRELVSPLAQPFFIPRFVDGASSPAYAAITPKVKAFFLKDRVLFRTHDLNFEVQFLGSDSNVERHPENPLAARINYLVGSQPHEWSTNTPAYAQLCYRGIYPGVDVRFSFSGGHLTSEFEVSAGAEPRQIRFRYTGLGMPRIDERGNLLFSPENGVLQDGSPIGLQRVQNAQRKVPAKFVLLGGGVVGFEVGAYDKTLPLVIDPVVSYSSYLGQQSDNAATAVATDSNGNVYVTGWTDAVDFPLAGPVQGANSGGVDAFVLKLNAAGNTLLYATYIGGSGDDRGYGIAVDLAGEVYVTGSTTSSNFPTRLPIQSGLRGSRDAFAFKLNAAGNGFIFSTYLGGSAADNGNAIAVDSQGNAYLTGDTTSSDFPTRGGVQATNNGRQDAFVTKLTGLGTLVYSTYLGGSGDDRGAAIAVDPAGNAYVTGGTFSTNFPTANPMQAVNGGGQDVFITKLASAGNSLVYSTYLGGSGGALGSPEYGSGIAVDSFGNAYVVGSTSSANFPVSAAFQPSSGGGTENAFITKLNSFGSAAVYSTYYGGSTTDFASAVAVDSTANVFVAGYTASGNLPLAFPLQITLAGTYDAFVLELNPSGSTLTFATYYGGSGIDVANGITLDSLGNLYVVGQTQSSDFPVRNALEASALGNMDAFIVKLGFGSPPDYTINVAPGTQIVDTGANTNYTVTVTGVNGFSGTVSLAASGLPPGVTASFNPATVADSGSSTLTITTTGGATAGTVTLMVTGTSGSLIHTATTSLTVVVAPVAVSVSPSTGTGSTQTFSFTFTDGNGASDIASTQMDIGPALAVPASCFFYYSAGSHAIYLFDDSGGLPAPLTIGSAGTAQNSQCSVNAGASSVVVSGNTLILNLALSFKAAYVGAKNVYMFAQNATQNSSWGQHGTWTVTSPPPSDFTISITPATQTVNTGANTSCTVTLAGINGFSGTVSLAASGWPSGVTASFNPTTVAGSGSSTLTITTTGSAAAGTATLMVTGTSGSLIHTATTSLTVVIAPVAVSVSPSAGSGSTKTFSFTFTDGKGASDIASAQIDIGAALAVPASCFFYYSAGSHAIYLFDDSGALPAPLTIGSAGTAQNSQCSVDAGASSVVVSGNTLTLNLAVSFKAAYLGAKNVFMFAQNATLNTGWAQHGTWTVTSPPPPDFAISVAPGAQTVNTGVNTNYTVTATGANGFTGTVSLAATGLPSGVTASFNPATVAGSGSSTLTITTTGSAAAGTLTATVIGTSGLLIHTATTSLTVVIAPVAVSVSPSTGTGSTQTFSFTFTDGKGASDIASAQIDIGPALAVPASCFFYYSAGSHAISLFDNSGGLPAPLTIGSAGTAQNSQCSVDAGASSVVVSGNTLTLNLAVSFMTAYLGPKNVYMFAQSATLNSGWAQHGTWTVTSPPDFTISMVPVAQTVALGATISYIVTVTGVNGFNGTVRLACSGLPSGATASFNPTTVAGSGSTTLTITTVGRALAGTATILVTGTSGSLTHAATPSFTIELAPISVSVSPANGTGLKQTFTFTFTDAYGANDIASIQIDIGSILSSIGSCSVSYVVGTDSIYLLDNAGVAHAPLHTGIAGTALNSQCGLNAGASSVVVGANTLTLNFALTFEASYAGGKNVYMFAQNATLNSGWVQRGAWSVP